VHGVITTLSQNPNCIKGRDDEEGNRRRKKSGKDGKWMMKIFPLEKNIENLYSPQMVGNKLKLILTKEHADTCMLTET